jgi:hypothetical protein
MRRRRTCGAFAVSVSARCTQRDNATTTLPTATTLRCSRCTSLSPDVRVWDPEAHCSRTKHFILARAAGTIIAARFNALADEPYRLRGDPKALNETADDASMTLVSPVNYCTYSARASEAHSPRVAEAVSLLDESRPYGDTSTESFVSKCLRLFRHDLLRVKQSSGDANESQVKGRVSGY